MIPTDAPRRGSRIRARSTLAGGLFLLVAAVFGVSALRMNLGSVQEMGPGLFPLLVAVLLALIGVATVVAGTRDDGTAEEGTNWRAVVLLSGAPLLFLAVVGTFGLAPATFCVCFASCLAVRDGTIGSAFLTALGVTAFGMLVFSLLLRVSDPMFAFEF